MRTTIRYSNKTFGNGENSRNYGIKIQRFGNETGDVQIEVSFDEYVDGRGTGYLAGSVKSFSLLMPVSVFSLIAEKFGAIKADKEIKKTEFHVDERFPIL